MVAQKRVAIYARVSTIDRGQDPETQLLVLRDYAARRGLVPAGEYVDYASGRRDDRPQYQALLAVARKRHIDVVLVWRYDRFARSTQALVHALNASSARVSFAEIETDRGHDAFLLDVPEFFDISRAFLESAGKARGLDSNKAFSSEVDSGSREENASKQKDRASFRFNRNGKGSRHTTGTQHALWKGVRRAYRHHRNLAVAGETRGQLERRLRRGRRSADIPVMEMAERLAVLHPGTMVHPGGERA